MTATRADGVRQRKAKASAAADPASAQVEEVDTSEAEEIEREQEEAEAERLRRKNRTPKQKVDDEDDEYSPWVDVLRVITFLVFASCALSYLISGGETFTWGMKHPPKYLQADWWKAKLVRYLPIHSIYTSNRNPHHKHQTSMRTRIPRVRQC